MAKTRSSIGELAELAAHRLKVYCDPTTNYAWPSYDVDDIPDQLTTTDLLAPAVLSYPLPTGVVQQLTGGSDSPYRDLRLAMEAVVTDPAATEVRFDELTEGELVERRTPGWGAVLKAFDAVQACRGLRSVAVSKILHRKRPRLVPIVDSRIKAFYGTRDSYEDLFTAMHADIAANRDLLVEWSAPYRLPDGAPMSLLRALDIVIWMGGEGVDDGDRDLTLLEQSSNEPAGCPATTPSSSGDSSQPDRATRPAPRADS